MTNKKKEDAKLDVCTQASVAEHARPNEPAADTCDDGRAGTRSQKKKVTDKNKSEDGKKGS